jgi:hypothetical protein
MVGAFWALTTSKVRPEPLPCYSRWQNFVYVRKSRTAYALILVFCFILAMNGRRWFEHGSLGWLGWLATGAMVFDIALFAVILAWPLPSPVHRQDKLKSA